MKGSEEWRVKNQIVLREKIPYWLSWLSLLSFVDEHYWIRWPFQEKLTFDVSLYCSNVTWVVRFGDCTSYYISKTCALVLLSFKKTCSSVLQGKKSYWILLNRTYRIESYDWPFRLLYLCSRNPTTTLPYINRKHNIRKRLHAQAHANNRKAPREYSKQPTRIIARNNSPCEQPPRNNTSCVEQSPLRLQQRLSVSTYIHKPF